MRFSGSTPHPGVASALALPQRAQEQPGLLPGRAPGDHARLSAAQRDRVAHFPPLHGVEVHADRLAAGQGRDNALLAPASAAAMQRLAQRGKGQDFGLGWFRRHAGAPGAPPFIEHLGGGAGFWTGMRLFPTLGLGLVVMGNATGYDHEAIGRHVLRHWAAPMPAAG